MEIPNSFLQFQHTCVLEYRIQTLVYHTYFGIHMYRLCVAARVCMQNTSYANANYKED